MISLQISDKSGQEVGTCEVDPAGISPEVNKQLLHDVVVMYEANRRVGTVKTKSRGQVRGSTQKLYRQKGTGRARAGSVRSPVRRGGGHTFRKDPLDWSYRLPKKAIKLATRMALRSKFEDAEVVVLDELSVDAPKTKVVAEIVRALGLADTTCLLAIPEYDANIWKSSRNIPNLQVLPTSDLNAYDLLHQKRLLVTKAALDQLTATDGNGSSADAR